MAKQRVQQVADTIQRVLGEAIQNELKDPRIGFATVTAVEVSADLQHARVQISVMGSAEEQQETMAGIQRARGFLRRRIAEELRHMRFVPELHFTLDTSLDYSLRIGTLLREVEDERKRQPAPDDDHEQ
jgi:ribosome-binding factor A